MHIQPTCVLTYRGDASVDIGLALFLNWGLGYNIDGYATLTTNIDVNLADRREANISIQIYKIGGYSKWLK